MAEKSPKLRWQLDLSSPEFGQPRSLTDVVFMVEEKPIYCSRYVLAEESPVFRAMFADDFKEKDEVNIPLPGQKYEEFFMVMKIIHPPCSVPVLSGEIAESILSIADEYQMSHLLRLCEEAMLPLTTINNAMKYLYLGQQHGLAELYKKAEGLCITIDLQEIKESEYFAPLLEENKVELLSNVIKAQYKVVDSIISAIGGISLHGDHSMKDKRMLTEKISEMKQSHRKTIKFARKTNFQHLDKVLGTHNITLYKY